MEGGCSYYLVRWSRWYWHISNVYISMMKLCSFMFMYGSNSSRRIHFFRILFYLQALPSIFVISTRFVHKITVFIIFIKQLKDYGLCSLQSTLRPYSNIVLHIIKQFWRLSFERPSRNVFLCHPRRLFEINFNFRNKKKISWSQVWRVGWLKENNHPIFGRKLANWQGWVNRHNYELPWHSSSVFVRIFFRNYYKTSSQNSWMAVWVEANILSELWCWIGTVVFFFFLAKYFHCKDCNVAI